MSTRLKTYTIGFSEASFDESQYAAAMAQEIGSDHHCETFNLWDERQLESLLRNHVGQPYADASLLPTSMVCERAARDVKVVLSGDGADELFGGYQRYQAQIIFRWYTRLPKALRAFAEDAIKRLPVPMVHHSRSLLKKAQLFVDAAERHGTDPRYIAPSLFSSPLYQSLVPELNSKGHRIHDIQEETSLNDLQRMLYSDCLIYLPQDILTKVDRASMAHSLEVRSPFLDSKIVEMAFSREANAHLGIGKGKQWLRSAFKDQLPGWVWRRRKQGFGVPLNKWFCGDLGDRLLGFLDSQNTPLDNKRVQLMLRDHRLGKADFSMGLWAIYVYLSVRTG
jgi:asparagine synthase (glutamine-hydrolysing)